MDLLMAGSVRSYVLTWVDPVANSFGFSSFNVMCSCLFSAIQAMGAEQKNEQSLKICWMKIIKKEVSFIHKKEVHVLAYIVLHPQSRQQNISWSKLVFSYLQPLRYTIIQLWRRTHTKGQFELWCTCRMVHKTVCSSVLVMANVIVGRRLRTNVTEGPQF